ncbi:uncharacterized [Tachysurus ichikawai]
MKQSERNATLRASASAAQGPVTTSGIACSVPEPTPTRAGAPGLTTSKIKTFRLPSCQSYNCEIKLVPGFMPPKGMGICGRAMSHRALP